MYVEKASPLSMQLFNISTVRLDFLQCIKDIRILQVAKCAFTEKWVHILRLLVSTCAYFIKMVNFLVFKITAGKYTMPIINVNTFNTLIRVGTYAGKYKGDSKKTYNVCIQKCS
jgi:hypothetical protein